MEGLIQIFYVRENKVFLKEKYEVLPEVIILREACRGREDRFNRLLEYIHFVYSKKSPYFWLELNQRRKVVCLDRFGDETLAGKVEKTVEAKALIEKYNVLQFTENEIFFDGVRKKISEYLRYWQENSVTKANSAELQEQLKGAKDLLKVKKEVEGIVYEEQRRFNMAKETGEKLFEQEEKKQTI